MEYITTEAGNRMKFRNTGGVLNGNFRRYLVIFILLCIHFSETIFIAGLYFVISISEMKLESYGKVCLW